MLYTERIDVDLAELRALETDDEDLTDVQQFDGLTVKEGEEETRWMMF